MRTFLHKKIIIIFLFSGIILVVLFLRIILTPPETTQPSVINPSPTITAFPSQTQKAQNLAPIKITPDNSVVLIPGNVQQFLLTFPTTINLSQISIKLTKIDITKNNDPVLIPIDTAVSNDGRNLSITTQPLIDPYSQYTLLATDRTNNATIFKTSFLSDKEKEVPVETNNLDLIPYLPYETAWYALSYVSSRNVYVFNFKYDPESKETLQVQFDRAKADALLFIKSKGIDESTIVIEWRNS